MNRTKLADRPFPSYTIAEERWHTVTHAIGALLGIAALVACLSRSIARGNVWGIVGSAIYGASLIALYSVSSVYHALPRGMAKQVMRVLDHCTINFLIAGTYTPILFCSIRSVSKQWAWIIFAIVWGFAMVATVLTAIDLKRYSKFAMACYLGMGWSILLAAETAIEAMPSRGFLFVLLGGIAYTLGAVLYGVGKKHRYFHAVFHVFVLLGSILQFLGIYGYVL